MSRRTSALALLVFTRLVVPASAHADEPASAPSPSDLEGPPRPPSDPPPPADAPPAAPPGAPAPPVLDLPFVFHAAPHFYVGCGPYVGHDIARSINGMSNDVLGTTGGVSTLVGGWL